MRSKLFITLSAFGLLGVSVATHSEIVLDNWTWYSKDGTSSRPSGKIPESDCLEMICEYGCVEKNDLIGYCCPGNGQCRVESGEDVDLCCEDGKPCIQGMCGCPTGTTEYIGIENTKACCDDTTHKLSTIEGTINQACCPIETPAWDVIQQKCVECIRDEDCLVENRYCAEDHTCKNLVGKECSKQSDCGGFNSGYFCRITSWNKKANSMSERNCYSDLKGECVSAYYFEDYGNYMRSALREHKTRTEFVEGVGNLTLLIFQGGMGDWDRLNWWSASNFCEAIGKELIDVSKFQIYKSGTSDLITNGVSNTNLEGFCAKNQVCDGLTDYRSTAFSPQASAVFKAFGEGWWVWTSSSVGNTSKNSCNAVELRGTGHVYFPGSRRTTDYGRYVINRSRTGTLGAPLCIDK